MKAKDAMQILEDTYVKQTSIKNKPKVLLQYLNLGILELHKRFALRTEYAKISAVVGTPEYTLDGNDPNVTIDLTDHEFLAIDDICDVDGICLYTKGRSLARNIIIPRMNVVRFKEIKEPDTFDVSYRAAPKFLIYPDQELPIFPQFYEALWEYVAYLAEASLRNQPDAESNVLYARFNASCARIEKSGLQEYKDMESDTFDERGFV